MVSQLKPALCAIGRYRGVSQLDCRKSRLDGPLSQESPPQTKPKKGQNEKLMNFAFFFANSGVFPSENKCDSHRAFVPVCPREKFTNWPFFWFGLPG